MLPSLSPQEFVAKWRKVELKERSASQSHFNDLCRLVGHPTPVEDDPTGRRFTFEAGASKSRGGQGWADVWKKEFFAWEYKGKHKDLDAAYQQLLQYHEALDQPPLLVVSDMDQIVVHTKFTNTPKRVVTITLDDLLTPAGQEQLRAVFFDPKRFRAPQTTEQVTQQAAAEFAHLADLLRAYGQDPQEAAHFLIRLLFCLFAEDIGLLPARLFSQLITTTQRRPAAFQAQLRELFQKMATGGWFGPSEIAHFDGRLFENDRVLPLDSDGLDILARTCNLDWSSMEPSILGTLFTRSLDPSRRAQRGAHYTSKEDILLIVEPVLMAPLRRRWAEVRQQALELARQRDEARSAQTRNKRHADIEKLVMGFAHELATTRVLDAACGSANFLYVALKLMLDLWKEVSVLAADLGLSRMLPLAGFAPSPEQLYGIEIDEYAHELAQATIWIGYIQWLHDNGFGLPSEPILKPLDNILHMDAILAYDEDGRPVEPEWPEAEVLVGNPPFLGNKRMRSELGEKYVSDLRSLYAGRLPGQVDLVCYWFEKARAMISQGHINRAGLLATQAIRAGANRRVLERIKETGDVFYAQADRPWILDGAAVRVSMVGFDDGRESIRLLNRNVSDPAPTALENAKSVLAINADLTSLSDVTKKKRLVENAGLCYQGPVKVGAFEIPDAVARSMLQAANVHGRSNAEVLKPWMNASDVTRRPRHMWIIDFDEMGLEEAAQFEAPFEYVRMYVRPTRLKNKDRQRRTYWWRLGRSGRDLKEANRDKERIIVTPRVARHRLFVWASPELVPDSRLFSFGRDDDYLFGVLHSRVDEVWSLATSSRHGVGNDPTYNNTTCFETFPFPWPPGQEPTDDPRVQAIAQTAKELVEKRDAWLNPPGASEQELKGRTLTNLYNRRPTWLDLAHRKLDEAVLDAYGWPHDLSDEEILERLLALNLERTRKYREHGTRPGG
jgi:type II restriction/modification system DNA methylase subunit YeeA